jgi:tetratricopeptide (TPR) repeat protein
MKKWVFLAVALSCVEKPGCNDFDVAAVVEKAVALEEAGNLQEALKTWIRAWYVAFPTQRVYDSLQSAFQKLLGSHMEKSEYDQAWELLDQAEMYFPNSYSFSRFRLYIPFAKQDFNRTIFYADELLKAFGSDQSKADEIHFYTGHAYQKMKAYSAALEHLELVGPKFDTPRSVLVLRGDCYYHRGDLKKATELLEAAQKLEVTSDVAAVIQKISRETPLDTNLAASAPTPHFIVRADKTELDSVTQVLAPLLETIFTDLGQTLQFYPETPITVIVYAGDKALSAKLGNPNWAAGVYDGEIRIPSSELKKSQRQLETLLRHETMHLFLDNFTRNQIPVWMNEGIAQYYEQPFSFDEGGFTRREEAPLPPSVREVQSQALKQNRILKMDQLSSPFVRMNRESAEQAYGQSLLMIKFLVESQGQWKLRRLLQEIYQGNQYQVALRLVTGLNPDEFLSAWVAHQKNAWKL